MLRRRQRLRAMWIRALLGGSLLLAGPLLADTSQRDLQVVARSLGFLDPPRSGTLNVGIVFDPAQPESERQAALLFSLLGSGLRVASLELKGSLVPVATAPMAPADLFLLVEGSAAAGAQLLPVLEARRLPCFTTDLAQVQAGHCSVGVQSAPSVEILVHRALAERSGLAFASVFRMMIKEL